MLLWVTKPSSYEVYMGGLKRSFKVWMKKPKYNHAQQDKMMFDVEYGEEFGWFAPNCDPVNIQPLVEQYPEFTSAIWDLVIQAEKPIDVSNRNCWSVNEENWSQLGPALGQTHPGCKWEEFSTIHFKRFLIELNTETKACDLIIPENVRADVLGNYIKGHDRYEYTQTMIQEFKQLGCSFPKKLYEEIYEKVHGAQF